MLRRALHALLLESLVLLLHRRFRLLLGATVRMRPVAALDAPWRSRVAARELGHHRARR